MELEQTKFEGLEAEGASGQYRDDDEYTRDGGGGGGGGGISGEASGRGRSDSVLVGESKTQRGDSGGGSGGAGGSGVGVRSGNGDDRGKLRAKGALGISPHLP